MNKRGDEEGHPLYIVIALILGLAVLVFMYIFIFNPAIADDIKNSLPDFLQPEEQIPDSYESVKGQILEGYLIYEKDGMCWINCDGENCKSGIYPIGDNYGLKKGQLYWRKSGTINWGDSIDSQVLDLDVIRALQVRDALKDIRYSTKKVVFGGKEYILIIDEGKPAIFKADGIYTTYTLSKQSFALQDRKLKIWKNNVWQEISSLTPELAELKTAFETTIYRNYPVDLIKHSYGYENSFSAEEKTNIYAHFADDAGVYAIIAGREYVFESADWRIKIDGVDFKNKLPNPNNPEDWDSNLKTYNGIVKLLIKEDLQKNCWK